MAITVQLPHDMEARLREEYPDLDRRVLEGYVVDAFRRGDISSGEAGQILGLRSRWAAIDFLSAHGVYPEYDVQDSERDANTLASLVQAAGRRERLAAGSACFPSELCPG